MNKTKISPRMTQRENEARVCRKLSGAGGLAPSHRTAQTVGTADEREKRASR